MEIAHKFGKAGLAAMVAAGALTTFAAGSAHADAASIVSIANSQLGQGPCSIGGSGYYPPNKSGSSCDGAGHKRESWCADFAAWVWGRSDVAFANELSSGAASFYDYGVKHGTRHSTPQVGDAIVWDFNSATDWASHVNLVTAVNGSSITVVGGNQSNSVTTYTINNAGIGSTSSTGQRISGFISPIFNGTTSNPSNLPAGTLVKSASSPTVKVIVGGAGLAIQGSDVDADHYDLSKIVTVGDAAFNALPAVPPNGTVVMDQSGTDNSRFVVVDGVALNIGGDDWVSGGYSTKPQMGVPTSWLRDATQRTLGTGVVVLDQSGADNSRYVMVRGAALPISGAEWDNGGYAARPSAGVPAAWLKAAVAKPVPDGTVVMDQNGADNSRFVMVGGAAAAISGAEWENDGYNDRPLMGVPGAWLGRAAAAKPADGVLLKGESGADSSVYVTANGSALPLTVPEYNNVWANRPTTGAPERWLGWLVAKPLANGTVITNASGQESTRYVMAGGKAVPLGAADFAALGYDQQPLRGVPGTWEATAAAKSAPADGTMLLSPDNTTVWLVVNNGHKRPMTPSEFGDGGYSFLDVVRVPTALTAALPGA
ncbi:CHAP domain-containing protein [Kitasatospora sp. CB01950]|uniref:CHAP domain-containing protein n=1 Tax=Kitasatospora sp. CB01950 TaxID=1703930 RepID=UPI000938AB11|nr:CHAP domain-containing protein [Kitasatospora sp. CB01950]